MHQNWHENPKNQQAEKWRERAPPTKAVVPPLGLKGKGIANSNWFQTLNPLNTVHLETTPNPLLRIGKIVINSNLGLSQITFFIISKIIAMTVTEQ